VVADLRKDGFKVTTNYVTKGPEFPRGYYDQRRKNLMCGINHTVIVMPKVDKNFLDQASDEDEESSLFKRIEILPPQHLATPGVINVFKEMEGFLRLSAEYPKRPLVLLKVTIPRSEIKHDSRHGKLYSSQQFLGLGKFSC